MSSLIKVLFLATLCSFITNCSLWSKSEVEKEEELARFQDYYPSDVYTDIANEGSDERSTASYEDDDYGVADEDPAASQDDEQNAYLDQQLDQEDEIEAGTDPLPVEKAVQPVAVQRVSKKAVSKKFKSGMHKFSINCEMKAQADASSKNVGKVKAGKKLWVENHNKNWAKVYKKSGAVFVNKGCL